MIVQNNHIAGTGFIPVRDMNSFIKNCGVAANRVKENNYRFTSKLAVLSDCIKQSLR